MHPNDYDDFDLDAGLDLDQFEYGADSNTQYDHKSIFADDNEEYLIQPPYDESADPTSTRYVTEIDDNVFLQSKPVYEGKYLRNSANMPYEDDLDDKAAFHSYTTERYTGMDHDSATPRDRYEREYLDYRQQRSVSRKENREDMRRPASRMDTESRPASRWGTGRSGRSTSRSNTRRGKSSSRKEKVRRFPAPDPEMPHIPIPDYDGASHVLYVPDPDY